MRSVDFANPSSSEESQSDLSLPLSIAENLQDETKDGMVVSAHHKPTGSVHHLEAADEANKGGLSDVDYKV